MMDFGHMEWFEALPLPVVSYSYGGFITFREALDSEHVFCSCMKPAIENYLQLNAKDPSLFPKGIEGMEALNDWYFPHAFLKAVYSQREPGVPLEAYLVYRDNICHRCIKATPMRTFRNSLKMPKFKKWYGWYIIIGYLESGVLPETFDYLPDRIDAEIESALRFQYSDLWEDLYRYEEIEHLDETMLKEWLSDLDQQYLTGNQRVLDKQYPENFRRAVAKALESKYTQAHRILENRIRKAFGKRSMAGQWTQENQLFSILKAMYPNEKVIQHYRPQMLEGLELDIFVKGLNLGIEYQGIQHYQPMEHLGGVRALEKTMERDLKKKALCEELGITLVYFHYDEVLSVDGVHQRVKEALEQTDFVDDNTYKTEDHHVMGLIKMAEENDDV